MNCLLLILLILCACSEKKKEDKGSNSVSNPYLNDATETVGKTYHYMKGTCDDFIASLDFSSFCFSSVKTPKYRLIQNTKTNCQIAFYDDAGFQNVTLSIAFVDFEKPIKKDVEPDPDMAKVLFNALYKRKKSKRMAHPEAKEISGLGDDAYIGFNQSKDYQEQYLGVRQANVTFSFIFTHGKEKANQSCMSSEEDLVRIGELILANL